MTGMSHWRNAEYEQWNEWLLNRCLLANGSDLRVTRIAAGPEELAAMVGLDETFGEEVAEAFVRAVKKKLPLRTSFCGYCLKQKGWTPESEDIPHFFGMLWFTCLLAAGYPQGAGDMYTRFESTIGKRDHFKYSGDDRCLDALWEALADWARNHTKYSDIELPPEDNFRKRIGRSYYLAFPSMRDRKILKEVLSECDLLEIDPPLQPTLSALRQSKTRFGADFRKELDEFVESFSSTGKDPADSAFWRAIRAEAMVGLIETEVDGRKVSFGMLAEWDDDGSLSIGLLSSEAMSIDGISFEPLDFTYESYKFQLTDLSGDPDTVAQGALNGSSSISRKISALVRQGLLAFREFFSGEFLLAMGDDIEGASVALVRTEMADALVEKFGGQYNDSRYHGWCEVENCNLMQNSELPEALSVAKQLLYTTDAPRPRIIGGIQVEDGYYWMPPFLPKVRTPGAGSVKISSNDQIKELKRGEDGDWLLPTDLQVEPPQIVEIECSYQARLEGDYFNRKSKIEIIFQPGSSGIEYKPVAKGNYWREACNPPQDEQTGREHAPLDITTSDETRSLDLLMEDPSLRYLGPGLGEMSLSPKPGFEWCAVGTVSTPRELIFIGDLDSPSLPDGGCCSNDKDRRYWRKALTNARKISALVDGRYVKVSDEPRLKDIHDAYVRRSRDHLSSGERICKPSGIDLPDRTISRPPTSYGRVQSVIEAFAALSLRKSGVPLKEFEELVSYLLRNKNPWNISQLVRGWSESGVIDLLRRQDRSRTMVVARRPGFVMTRKGTTVDARLLGLVPKSVVDALRIKATGCNLKITSPPNMFQPVLFGLEDIEPDRLREVSQAIGLCEPRWLDWDLRERVPSNLATDSVEGIEYSKPSDAYVLNGTWDWSRMGFFRNHESTDDVIVQKRYQRHRCSIYVVNVCGEDMLWCYIRDWALLRAAELENRKPFSARTDGGISSEGASPMHLPLPFGRLCAVLGSGPPGPKFDEGDNVRSYVYPFGVRMQKLIKTAIPDRWLSNNLGES